MLDQMLAGQSLGISNVRGAKPGRKGRAARLAGLVAAFGLAGAMLATNMPTRGDQAAVAQEAMSAQLSDVLKSMSVEEQMYHQHIVTLSNPFFEGRAPGLRGNVLAQDYIEFYFKEKFGLEPLFPVEGSNTKSYRQEFSPQSENVVTGSKLVIKVGDKESDLLAGEDYNVLGMSGSGTADGDVVFCGYSIDEGPEGYATFTPKDDLAGKIAMILRFEPKNEQGKSKWGKNGNWSPTAGLGSKLAAARERGAAGIILVNPPGADDPRTNTLEDFRTIRGMQGSIPVMMVTIEKAAAICKGGGKDLMALVKQADASGGITPIGTKVVMESKIDKRPVKTANVAGVLRGKGALADQYVIIGGHYDHLGYGYFGSRASSPAGKLHPGADDNGSGTSGVLLAAQKMSEAYKKLPADANIRSVIFMGFSAEESGLIGSRYFVRHAPVKAEQVYLMINMDMIGRLRNDKLDVGGGLTGEGLCDVIDPIFAKTGLTVRTRNAEGVPFNGQGPSDHAEFNKGGIPVLFFFTGLHPEYHMPTDLYPTINVPGAVKVVGAAVDVANVMVRRTEAMPYVGTRGEEMPIDFTQTMEGMRPAARPAPAAGPGAADAAKPAPPAGDDAPAPRRQGSKVRFGIMPDTYSDETPGVMIGDVYEGLPAAEAGLKKGDRMTKWNGTIIKDVSAWMPLLGKANPGDVVEITYLRDGKELTTKAKLTARNDSPK